MARMTAAQAAVEILKKEGVTHVFGLPGAAINPFYKAMKTNGGLEHTLARHVEGASHMAEGYTRAAAGNIGVCVGTSGPAGTDMITGLYSAWADSIPILAITGQAPVARLHKEDFQAVDIAAIAAPVTKWATTVLEPGQVPGAFAQAFHLMRSGRPGPVLLDLPIDVQLAEIEFDIDTYEPLPVYRPAATRAQAEKVLDLLESAERPVIVAGGGVRASRAGAALVALARHLQIPVATSLNGKDSISGTDPLSVGVVGSYSRETANIVVNRADLICFVGTQTGGMTTNVWTVPPIGTPAIQIDIDASQLGRNYPLQAAVLGDARAVLTRMAELAPAQAAAAREAWLGEVADIKRDWFGRYASVLTSDDVPIRPERICGDLNDTLPGNAIVVVDTGHAGMWMGQFFDSRGGDQSYLRSCGHLGWAYCAGLGAKCAQPGRPTVVFTGDAGLYYHLGEIETAVRRKINTITVVNNNSGGNQSKRGFDRAYGGTGTERSRELWTYEDMNFARLAEDMGAVGLRVDKAKDLRSAIEHALELERPVIVDVRTDIEVLAPAAVS
jgi:acetolactate synthase-1/2/3 large subunit